ncbi:Ubiquitin thioesterase OTUB1 [Stagonosporopsis vannaccii]|nr:Ubiquitin thioesterase OTUB1 [Stagonosporopsis vannaccii]
MTGGFHSHGVGHGHGHGVAHLGGHYGVHAQNAYGSAAHSGLTFGRPLPIRAPAHPPAFNHQHTGQHQHQHPHQHGRPATFSMADPAFMTAEEEHAYMQKLASEYEPEATVSPASAAPLLGERQSSAAITTQYANADPVYRIKTAALPGKYAYFRTCRGDGHCGWRAIAFTYFEALLRLGDGQRFADEEGRLISMGNLLDNIGYSRDIWIDFADEAYDLLRKLGHSVEVMDGNAADILLQAFNDMGISMAIITYFKPSQLLASAWVQNHADDFRHFVPMGDVKAYCNNNIDPAQCEADNIGVAALADALVKPAGFGLEVWYLDRSPGEEINRSYYAEPTVPGSPMLRLLYRPGHYDILYKAEDVPSPIHHPVAPQAPLQVNFTNYADEFLPQASNFGDVMSMLPGMGRSNLGGWASLSYDCHPNSTPQPQPTPISPFPSASMSAPPITSSLDFITPISNSQATSYSAPRHHSIQLDQPPITLPMHPAPPPPPPPVSVERTAPLAVESGGPFRPSMYQLEPGFGFSNQAQPFQTSIFRNSHFNTAHFMNPDFQPEEWCPDGEYPTGNKSRHKHPS